ncbi:MAG: mannonate dehydratase [Cyclobacteriaceae bacterium]|jgi:mannonate dehydratase
MKLKCKRLILIGHSSCKDGREYLSESTQCLGSTALGRNHPKNDILPIIKWVGDRKQIFNIHLRNIKGRWNAFQEVYPDNGDMDFALVIKALRNVGYDGMVMPDHIPAHDDPASGLQGHAFAFGYIKALIHAIGGDY